MTVLKVVMIIILVFNYSFGNAEDGDYWWYGQVKRLSDSKCGKRIDLTFEEDKTVYLRYDGAMLPDPCVVNISIYNPISKYSIICIVLNEVYEYSSDYDCREHFRFYFGKYPKKNSSNYYSCSDIHEPACDYSYSTMGFAVFHPWDKSENKTTIEVKLYILSGFPKPPTTSRPTQRTFSTLSSWSEWSSDDHEQTHRNTSLIIILVIAGFVVLIIICGFYCMHGKVNSTSRNRSDPGSEDRPHEYIEYYTGSTSNSGERRTVSHAIHLDSLPQAEENTLHTLPSAPPAFAPEEQTEEAPPPSYASLFGKI